MKVTKQTRSKSRFCLLTSRITYSLTSSPTCSLILYTFCSSLRASSPGLECGKAVLSRRVFAYARFAPKIGLKPALRRPPLVNPERRGTLLLRNRTPTNDGYALGKSATCSKVALVLSPATRCSLTRRHARNQTRCARLAPH